MSWFLRGVQSAVFHYASCAPCTGWADGRKRRRAAKAARKIKDKLHLEDPNAYQHPPPTGTNPFWDEEIRLGPGPPPRRARRTNTNNAHAHAHTHAHTETARRVNTAGTQHSAGSEGSHGLRLSDDTTTTTDDDDNTWNHKRYQREDEDLWGIDEPAMPLQHVASQGSSVGVTGYSSARPTTSRSGSYYSVRAPPVNDLHPPVVSMPSPDPADNRWMLQPPPKASVMAGRERASNRSRSGSGASSRVELSLQRQLSTKHVKHKLDRGETPELPSISRNSSYNNLVAGQRHERGRTVNVRPPSASSSRRKKRHDTVLARTDTASTHTSSGEPGDTVRATRSASGASDIRVIRVRQSRPALSTVVSSGSGANDSPSAHGHSEGGSRDENALPKRAITFHHTSTTSSTPTPHLRAPLSSSDVSSLNVLQDLVSPGDLLKSRFVSAPLVEAKIRLPADDYDEESTLNFKQSWARNRFSSTTTDQQIRVPFDNEGSPARDPRFRWSVDF